MRTQIYDVNLVVGAGIPPIVKVSQNDELRVLAFRLFDGIREYFPFENEEVIITGTKPSGLGFTEVCNINGSLATVETTLAMTQESGSINAELRISDGSTNIGTANFTLYVEPAPHPAGTTDGTTEEARTVLEQCAQYAQEAHEAASDVAPQVESLVDAAVADKMEEIEDAVQSVTDAATQAVSDITAAGEAVEESIPADYTALSTQVGTNATAISQLQADLGDLDDRVEALEEGGSSGSGLTDTVKTALMNLVNHLAWDDDDPTGQTYITALYNALYPPAELVSISAVYTQSGAIYETNELDDLKDDLVVTALMSDQTTRPVTDYTLSGTLTEGTSTITVTYGGKTTTFTVTVSHEAVYTRQVTEAGTFIKSGVYASNYDGTSASIAEDVYSISDVRAGDVIQLATNWNSANVVGKESRWISTPSKVAPDITAGTFTKVGTSYGLYPVTINQDYELLYIGIANNSSGAYKQYCTWTRESGF